MHAKQEDVQEPSFPDPHRKYSNPQPADSGSDKLQQENDTLRADLEAALNAALRLRSELGLLHHYQYQYFTTVSLIMIDEQNKGILVDSPYASMSKRDVVEAILKLEQQHSTLKDKHRRVKQQLDERDAAREADGLMLSP